METAAQRRACLLGEKKKKNKMLSVSILNTYDDMGLLRGENAQQLFPIPCLITPDTYF